MEVDGNLKILHIIRHKWALGVWIWHRWHAASHHSQSVCLPLRVVDRLPLLLLLFLLPSPSSPLLSCLKLCWLSQCRFPALGTRWCLQGNWGGRKARCCWTRVMALLLGSCNNAGAYYCLVRRRVRRRRKKRSERKGESLTMLGGCFPGCSCLICWANWSVSRAACFDSGRLEKLLYRSSFCFSVNFNHLFVAKYAAVFFELL